MLIAGALDAEAATGDAGGRAATVGAAAGGAGACAFAGGAVLDGARAGGAAATSIFGSDARVITNGRGGVADVEPVARGAATAAAPPGGTD